MFSYKYILAAILAVATATPTVRNKRGALAPVDIDLCLGVDVSCVAVPVSDTCTDFINGLSVFDKQVSSVIVPDGLICTFSEALGCSSSGTGSIVVTGGFWEFSDVEGQFGPQNFDNQASSFICSVL